MGETRYIEGGQTFTNYDQAVAAMNTVQAQIQAGGDAIIRTPLPGGILNDDTVAQIQSEQDYAASLQAAPVVASVSETPKILVAGIVGVLGLILWRRSRR